MGRSCARGDLGDGFENLAGLLVSHVRVNGQADVAGTDVLGDGQALTTRVPGENWLAVQRQVVDLARQPDVMLVGQLALEPRAIDTRHNSSMYL